MLIFGGILLAVMVIFIIFIFSDDEDTDSYEYQDSELQDLNTDGQVDMNDAELYIEENLNK